MTQIKPEVRNERFSIADPFVYYDTKRFKMQSIFKRN